MTAEQVAALWRLSGIEATPGAAALAAAELAALAERLRASPVRPAIDDVPGDFPRALR